MMLIVELCALLEERERERVSRTFSQKSADELSQSCIIGFPQRHSYTVHEDHDPEDVTLYGTGSRYILNVFSAAWSISRVLVQYLVQISG